MRPEENFGAYKWDILGEREGVVALGNTFVNRTQTSIFKFLVPCVEIQLCNVKQQNALFKLTF